MTPATHGSTERGQAPATAARTKRVPLLRVRFSKSVDRTALPPVKHRDMRVITRHRVYLLGVSWADR